MSVDVLLNIGEGAKMLSISVKTFRRMVARGEIPVVRLSAKTLRYRQSDIQAIISGDFSKQLASSRSPHLDRTGNSWTIPSQRYQLLDRK